MLNSLTSNSPRNRCQPEAVLRKVLAATIMCAVVIVLGTGSLFGIWTTLTAFRPEGQEVQREGIARIDHCRPNGPLSTSGFGTWWECSGKVRWDGDQVSALRTTGPQLTPQDRGAPVPVAERLVSCRGCQSDETRTYRAGFQPSSGESIATSAAILGTAFFLLVITAGTLVRVGLLPKPNSDPATWSAGADTGQ